MNDTRLAPAIRENPDERGHIGDERCESEVRVT
jgi:hypothetical protein